MRLSANNRSARLLTEGKRQNKNHLVRARVSFWKLFKKLARKGLSIFYYIYPISILQSKYAGGRVARGHISKERQQLPIGRKRET